MKNAIERRLDALAELWGAFAADPSLRLLRWRGSDDDLRLVDLFLDLQNEELGTTPDLFIRLTIPFTDPTTHGFDLARALYADYEASREALRDDRLAADWHPPRRRRDEADTAFLLRLCASLHAYYREHIACLALVLAPAEIRDVAAYGKWLLALLGQAPPPELRLTLLDREVAPLLDGIDDAAPALVRTLDPALDTPTALEELARAGGNDGPAKDFRIHMVNLGGAAAKANPAGAKRAAKAALKIARAQGWLDQEVVVCMALGAAMLSANRAERAVACYRTAVDVADRARGKGHPAGAQLAVITRMAHGSALFAAERYADATAVYEAAAPIAEARPDPVMTLEAWRMAAYCHELDGRARDAWRCSRLALDAGARLPADQRAASTLGYVGQAMLRLLERHGAAPERAQEVHRRMRELLGPDWAEGLEPGSAAA